MPQGSGEIKYEGSSIAQYQAQNNNLVPFGFLFPFTLLSTFLWFLFFLVNPLKCEALIYTQYPRGSLMQRKVEPSDFMT